MKLKRTKMNTYLWPTFLVITLLFIGDTLQQVEGEEEKEISPEKSEVFIAGGKTSKKGQFPWIVSIQATNFQEGYHLCGGVLLRQDWALTAAHCLDSEKPEWLWVVTGEYDMRVEEGTEQKLTVDYFVQHSDYIYWEKPYTNDVALIHLASPATLDAYTQLAPLAAGYTSDLSDQCQESGWGAMSTSSGLGSDVLLYADTNRLSSTVCLNAYNSFPTNQICAGNVDGVGFCAGDNGGPLVCNDVKGIEVIAGIMSWRSGCAEAGKPGVYMDVLYYKPWIFRIIGY